MSLLCVIFEFNVFFIAYSVFYYLNVIFVGCIISDGEERVEFSANDYSYICCFCSEEFPLPVGDQDSQRCFIVPSI